MLGGRAKEDGDRDDDGGELHLGKWRLDGDMVTRLIEKQVVTELYTIMTGIVVHETSWILATRTNTVTSCTDGSATPTGSEVPAR
jgi:hypothetical protein